VLRGRGRVGGAGVPADGKDHADTARVCAAGRLIAAATGRGLYELTASGESALDELGLDLQTARAQRRRFACSCMDWSMRRPHLAGALGGAFLQMALSRKWVVQDLDSRALAVTPKGRKALAGQFGLQSEIHDDALSAAQGRAVNAIYGVF